MNTLLVSVIMPARDVAKYIGEAIASVLQQQYAHWELIVVENASKDNTADVVRTFQDVRIKLIHTEVPGLSNARNIGLDHAVGNYICFLDADDRLPPSSISSRVRLLEANEDVMFADGGMQQFDESMKHLHHVWHPNFRGNPHREMMLLFPKCFCGITWMIRRKEGIALRFNTTWTHLEDRLFFLTIAPCGNYDYVNDITYQIRRRRGSLMTKLEALEQAYSRYMQHVNILGQLGANTQRNERVLFHRMFFRTYLKRFRLRGALRHLWLLLFTRE